MIYKEEGKIKIHTENIFPIIKKAVYSDHEIFIRELISNSVDAINKRRMASIAGDVNGSDLGKIEIKIDKENKSLTISDNGIGMTAEEVKKYINQVAFSSAEEFLEKYNNQDEQIIGHFGLGFYSSFMVAKNVEIITLSAIPESKSVKWECDGSPSFKLEEYNKKEIGTEVTLYLSEDELEYLEVIRIKSLITKYCDYMPIEIILEGEVCNKVIAPWKKTSKDITDNEYKEFYNYLYPFQGDPLFWIHLNTDYPYNLQGILYFPKITGRADWEQGEIKLYSNQVYVSDSIKEVVPRYLLPLRGILDSPDIPLNVSRSALQSDRRVKSIGNFVAKKVSSRLKEIKSEDKKFYCEIWESLSPFIKIGSIEDQKFADLVEDLIMFPSSLQLKEDEIKEEDEIIYSDNKVYTTIKGYIKRIKNDSKKILYCTDSLSQASPMKLWTSQGYEVLMAEGVIDTQFIPWLEQKFEDINFQRVDAEIDDELQEKEPELTDSKGERQSDVLINLIKESLNNDKITIKVQSLKNDDAPPALILLPEQMRRISDIGALMEQKLPGLPDNHVLLVNRSHPIVKGLLKLNSGSVLITEKSSSPSNSLTNEIVYHIYDMARLGIGGMEPNEIGSFQARNSDLMGKLIEKAL
tara:strand:+ start:220 stop:2127 length:1908 start_codon:yes stop_codon:yes gene_type:complete